MKVHVWVERRRPFAPLDSPCFLFAADETDSVDLTTPCLLLSLFLCLLRLIFDLTRLGSIRYTARCVSRDCSEEFWCSG